MEQVLGALKEGGPWLSAAGIAILLLYAVVKVVILDHSLVPFSLLQAERDRTDKAMASAADTTKALQQLTATIQDLKEVVEQMRGELRRGEARPGRR